MKVYTLATSRASAGARYLGMYAGRKSIVTTNDKNVAFHFRTRKLAEQCKADWGLTYDLSKFSPQTRKVARDNSDSFPTS